MPPIEVQKHILTVMTQENIARLQLTSGRTSEYSKPVVLKVWYLDKQSVQHLKTCWKCKCPSSIPDLLNQKLCGEDPIITRLQVIDMKLKIENHCSKLLYKKNFRNYKNIYLNSFMTLRFTVFMKKRLLH